MIVVPPTVVITALVFATLGLLDEAFPRHKEADVYVHDKLTIFKTDASYLTRRAMHDVELDANRRDGGNQSI